MLCKEIDNKGKNVALLESLLLAAPPDKKPLIERELRAMRAGIKGEQESAYLIDFHLKDSKNTAVIHDLRLDLGDGRVAQIDHLLIHRTYRFYVLETKHFSHGVKITDTGEFLRWNDWKKTFEGMPSPLEQNERHATVLRKTAASIGLSEPHIESLVLVAPHARIDRPKHFDTSKVVKADQFMSALEKSLESGSFFSAVSGLVKTAVSDSIGEIAQKLVALHRPITIDYAAKFGLAPAPAPGKVPAVKAAPNQETLSQAQFQCRACGSGNISIQYGKYGYYFKCGDCQGNTPIKLSCGHADHKERIRKNGLNFYRECGDCGTSMLYFSNRNE